MKGVLTLAWVMGGSPLGALKQTLHPETLMEEIRNPLGTSLAV